MLKLLPVKFNDNTDSYYKVVRYNRKNYHGRLLQQLTKQNVFAVSNFKRIVYLTPAHYIHPVSNGCTMSGV